MIQVSDAARKALAEMLSRSTGENRSARLLIDDYT